MNTKFEVERSWAAEPLFYRAPHPPARRPREYQFAGVEYALNRDNAIIGDAPGVGKSAQAVLISNAIEANQTLIVCPASLRLNWAREVRMWSTIEDVTASVITKATNGVSFKHDFVILSYDALRNDSIVEALMEKRWDHVIYDEGHYIKDPKGNKRTRVICAEDMLPSVAGRTTILSGTLMPNQPIECYNAMRLLDWSSIDGMSVEAFREYYYGKGFGFVNKRVRDPLTNKVIWKAEPSYSVRNQPRNLDELQERLRSHLMVRRLKEDVMKELPPKAWHPFPLAMTAALRHAINHPGWVKAERLYDMDAHAFDGGIPIDGEVSTARRLLGEAKAEGVADYVEDMLEEREKLVVSCWHQSVMSIFRERFKGYRFVEMVAGMTAKAQQAAVDQFQTDPRVRMILGQSKVIGLGHTLTAAQDVIVAEPDWTPGNNDQLLDRCHRMGQRGNVLGHIPVVPGTLDERVLATAIEKDQNIYNAMDRRD